MPASRKSARKTGKPAKKASRARTRARKAKPRPKKSPSGWLKTINAKLVINKIREASPGIETSEEEARLLAAAAAVRARDICREWDADLKELLEDPETQPEIKDSAAHAILLLCYALHTKSIQEDSSKRCYADAVKTLRAAIGQSSQSGRIQNPGCRQRVVLECAGEIARQLRASLNDPAKREFFAYKTSHLHPTPEELNTALRFLAGSVPSFPSQPKFSKEINGMQNSEEI